MWIALLISSGYVGSRSRLILTLHGDRGLSPLQQSVHDRVTRNVIDDF